MLLDSFSQFKYIFYKYSFNIWCLFLLHYQDSGMIRNSCNTLLVQVVKFLIHTAFVKFKRMLWLQAFSVSLMGSLELRNCGNHLVKHFSFWRRKLRPRIVKWPPVTGIVIAGENNWQNSTPSPEMPLDSENESQRIIVPTPLTSSKHWTLQKGDLLF